MRNIKTISILSVLALVVILMPDLNAILIPPQAPNKPVVTGDTNVEYGSDSYYVANTTDPQGDNIAYRFKFYYRDTKVIYTEWTTFVPSGYMASVVYQWDEIGVFQVASQAKDVFGYMSEWGVLDITVPKPKTMSLNMQGVAGLSQQMIRMQGLISG
jgi:hypothetical protein